MRRMVQRPARRAPTADALGFYDSARARPATPRQACARRTALDRQYGPSRPYVRCRRPLQEGAASAFMDVSWLLLPSSPGLACGLGGYLDRTLERFDGTV